MKTCRGTLQSYLCDKHEVQIAVFKGKKRHHALDKPDIKGYSLKHIKDALA